jgi:hypothetical protein
MATSAVFVPAIPATVSNLWEVTEDVGKSPVLSIHRARQSLVMRHEEGVEALFRKNKLRAFLLEEVNKDGYCKDVKNPQRSIKCSCMQLVDRFSEEDAVAVVNYLFGFAILSKSEQQTFLLTEWMKYADTISGYFMRGDIKKRKTYLLPGTTFLICKDALCQLLGIKATAFAVVAKMAKNNLPPAHGMCGVSNALNSDMDNVLQEYFDEVLQLATPRATLIIRCLVRDHVQTELKGDDEGFVELPSYMSKRSLYDCMLAKLGWVYSYDGKSKVIALNRFNEEREQQEAPSWSTFRRYWQTHHPTLVIAGAREDVCNNCYIFANRHRYATNKQKRLAEEGNADDEGPPGQEAEEQEDGDAVAVMLEGEELVKVAAKHVEMAQQQRELYQQKRTDAIDTKDLPPKERVLCFVADYAQNMPIPHFASEQPGATYYYSPLNAYIFGVVDASVD